MTKDEARGVGYRIPYADWTAQHRTPANDAKKAAFDKAFAENVGQKD